MIHGRNLARDGVQGLLAIPISFVSEHIETLEEIDMEYRELAEESGIAEWQRVPALNTNKAFIDDLADAVLEALPYVGSMVGSSEPLVPIGKLKKAVGMPSIVAILHFYSWVVKGNENLLTVL